jgi:hypothetical protein
VNIRSTIRRLVMSRCVAAIGMIGALLAPAFAQAENVLTYHYDTLRTGWNQNETTLTPSSVVSSFKLQHTVALDEQVDAQPLLVTGQTIAGQGVHDVVYVATENNSVYAVDAASGQILLHSQLGIPVPRGALPGGCVNNSGMVGINSTPVIDQTTQTMYVIGYSLENNNPVYRIHALALDTLTGRVPPVLVQATAKLSNGQIYSFSANANRLRAGLLEANGNIYAAFASFCDLAANVSRGWILGWKAGTLTPLAGNELVNKQATSPNTYFLSEIWMSGAGIASDASGDLFFSTGNSDPSGTSYSSTLNLAESVIRLSPDLTTVKDWFTPAGTTYGQPVLDKNDGDLGSGGVLLLPPQPGAVPNLAVVAGKTGPMFLLNRANLGNNASHSAPLRQTALQPGCWCTQSYFQGPDGVGRIVSSFGNNVIVWVVRPTSTSPFVTLTKGSSNPYPVITAGQDPGFFTAVSSNGTKTGTYIIWGVSRPVDTNPADVSLYAWDAGNGSQLVSTLAGTWPSSTTNANVMPVVANGRVYVASFKQLAIFGLGAATAAHGAATAAQVAIAHPAPPPQPALPSGVHEIFGTITSVNDTLVLLQDRNGQVLRVGTMPAVAASQSVLPVVGQSVVVQGTFDNNGTVQAQVVMHAKRSPKLWPPDR